MAQIGPPACKALAYLQQRKKPIWNWIRALTPGKYTEGMAYKAHTDDPIMGSAQSRYRSDVAVTVFLNDESTYDGGELVIHTQFGPVSTRLPAGSAVAYPASSLHEVTPITRGERLACVLWAQSLVRDPQQREILFETPTI